MATRDLNVTVELGPDSDAPPADPPFTGPVGFKSKLTRVANGSVVEPPTMTDAYWLFTGLNVGDDYTLDLSIVDGQGRVIQAWAPIAFTVPAVTPVPSPTLRYNPIVGVKFDWV